MGPRAGPDALVKRKFLPVAGSEHRAVQLQFELKSEVIYSLKPQIYINSFARPVETSDAYRTKFSVFLREADWLMLLKGIFAMYCENRS